MPGAGTNAAEFAGDAGLPSHSNPCLQETRDSHALCGAVLSGWKGFQPDSRETHAPTMVSVSEATRPRNSRGFDAACYRRQLQHPQTRQGEILDAVAQPTTTEILWIGPHGPAFHPDFQFLDEPGRTILPGYQRGRDPRGQLHQCQPTSPGDDGILGRAQSQPEALRVEGKGRGDLGQNPKST